MPRYCYGAASAAHCPLPTTHCHTATPYQPLHPSHARRTRWAVRYKYDLGKHHPQAEGACKWPMDPRATHTRPDARAAAQGRGCRCNCPAGGLSKSHRFQPGLPTAATVHSSQLFPSFVRTPTLRACQLHRFAVASALTPSVSDQFHHSVRSPFLKFPKPPAHIEDRVCVCAMLHLIADGESQSDNATVSTAWPCARTVSGMPSRLPARYGYRRP